MPRTIESIIDNHRAAAERRAAGRPVWDRTLRVKHLLTQSDGSDESARTVGQQIATILRASDWLRADEESRGAISEVRVVAEEFEDITDAADFKDVLDRMYDLADADRVWVS